MAAKASVLQGAEHSAIIYDIECDACKKQNAVEPFTVWRRKLYDWYDGELAQNAFPDLDTEQREALMSLRTKSYMCMDCWNGMFTDEKLDERIG